MNKRALLCSAIAALVLSACGGGGGDGGGEPIPGRAYNLDQVLQTVLAQGVSFPNLHGSLAGVDFWASVAFQPATDASFRGVIYKRSIQTISMSSSVTPPETFTQTLFYSVNPTRLAGAIDQQGLQATFSVTADLPTSAVMGQTGPYAHVVGYAADNQTVVGENWLDWSVEPDAPGMALACLVWKFATFEPYEKDCFRIDASGSIVGTVMTMYFDEGTLEFR